MRRCGGLNVGFSVLRLCHVRFISCVCARIAAQKCVQYMHVYMYMYMYTCMCVCMCMCMYQSETESRLEFGHPLSFVLNSRILFGTLRHDMWPSFAGERRGGDWHVLSFLRKPNQSVGDVARLCQKHGPRMDRDADLEPAAR